MASSCFHTLTSPQLSPQNVTDAHCPPLHASFSRLKLPSLCFRPPNHAKHNRFSPCTASAVSTKDFLLASQPTFYDLLGISHDVTLVDIKHAYRQMARKCHPDVCPANLSEESTRRFIEIQEAYEILSDPRRRAIYDRTVATGLGTVGRSWSFSSWDVEDSDVYMGHWRSHWSDQLNGLKRRNATSVNASESWAAKVRKQRERMYC